MDKNQNTLTLKSLFSEPPRKDNMITQVVDIFMLYACLTTHYQMNNITIIYVRALNIIQVCLHKY